MFLYISQRTVIVKIQIITSIAMLLVERMLQDLRCHSSRQRWKYAEIAFIGIAAQRGPSADRKRMVHPTTPAQVIQRRQSITAMSGWWRDETSVKVFAWVVSLAGCAGVAPRCRSSVCLTARRDRVASAVRCAPRGGAHHGKEPRARSCVAVASVASTAPIVTETCPRYHGPRSHTHHTVCRNCVKTGSPCLPRVAMVGAVLTSLPGGRCRA